MGADRARITYDPQRQYRSVVAQQGRVTLEADTNEGSRIETEELREETLDIVGPCGTPDNGYAVTTTAGDLNIGPGTMYVGGWRVTREKIGKYSKQSEWLDFDGDPLWQPLNEVALGSNFHVCLLLREQEIVAVEDPALREVALGGPDSAARYRLLQRVLAIRSSTKDCADAEKQLDAFWKKRGLQYDPATAALNSFSRLQVSFINTPPAPSPCDPPSQSGYLGADNQLIRVKIASIDTGRSPGRLLWGFNNASFLYRVKVLDDTTLEFQSSPIDDYHTPQIGQTVEILRRAAGLGDDAFAAATDGVTAKLAAAYAPDTRQLKLPNPLPPEYVKDTNLYLRIWEEESVFTPGQAFELKGTGLGVTITAASNQLLQLGAYWSFAARPTTPNVVYPERYLKNAQPPDGPRMWLCPLAVVGLIAAGNAQLQVIDDCRQPFDNLVELTKRHPDNCCCVTLTPGKPIQTALNDLARLASDSKLDNANAVLKLTPGEYVLDEPIRIEPRHSGIRIEACGRGVTLRASKPTDERFVHGMMLLTNPHRVTIKGISFQLPNPVFQLPSDKDVPSPVRGAVIAASFGIRAALADELSILECEFLFPDVEPVFGAAVFLEGDMNEPRIEDCRFIGRPSKPTDNPDNLGTRFVVGILVTARPPAKIDALKVAPVMSGASIRRNSFLFLSFGIFILARGRRIAIENNTSRVCWCSVMLLSVADTEKEAAITKFALEDKGDEEAKKRSREYLDAVRNLPPVTVVNSFGALAPDPGWTLESQITLTRAPRTAAQSEKSIDRAITTASQQATANLPSSFTLVEAGVFVPIVVAATARPAGPGLDLMMSGNTFDSLPISPAGSASGPAVFIWDVARDTISAGAISGNNLINRSKTAPTLMVFTIEAFNITGNVVMNDMAAKFEGDKGSPGNSRFSLWIIPGGIEQSVDMNAQVNLFTVTGNTFFGATNLRLWPRADWIQRLAGGTQPPSALVTWKFFNTEA